MAAQNFDWRNLTRDGRQKKMVENESIVLRPVVIKCFPWKKYLAVITFTATDLANIMLPFLPISTLLFEPCLFSLWRRYQALCYILNYIFTLQVTYCYFSEAHLALKLPLPLFGNDAFISTLKRQNPLFFGLIEPTRSKNPFSGIHYAKGWISITV